MSYVSGTLTDDGLRWPLPPGRYDPNPEYGGTPTFVTSDGEMGWLGVFYLPGHHHLPDVHYEPKPPTPLTAPEPSPTYDQPVQAAEPNRPRVGKVIPEHFGRLKIFPDLAARERRDGETVSRLYCIGRGHYQVERVLIDEVDAATLGDVSVTVAHASDPALAPQWPSYVADNRAAFTPVTLTTAFTAAVAPGAPGRATTAVTFWLRFPDGLYQIDANGDYQPVTVGFQIQYRAAGSADPWQVLAGAHTLTAVLVARRDARIDLTTPAGSWEFRIARTAAQSTDPRVRDRAELTGVRVVGQAPLDGYGDVTLLVVKSTGRRIGKVACVATRKLPVWNGSWSAPQATRSIPWAVAEVVRTVTGSDAMLDLPALQALDVTLAARGDHFDGRFDNPLSAMEAIDHIARAGRCSAFVQFGLLRLVRDEAQTGYSAMFTPLNMRRRSWQLKRLPRRPDEPDHYIVEYLDAADWRVKEVVCDLGSRTKPKRLKLFGVTDKLQAWREGMYWLRTRRYRRKLITFTTGLEGRALQPLDRILVGHDVYGFIHFGELYAIYGSSLILSNPVNFYGQPQADLYLRQPDGSPVGPLKVTPGDTDYQVNLVDPLPAGTYRTVTGDQHPQRTHYLFDPLGRGAVAARVSRIVERGPDAVEVTAVVEEAQLYQEGDPPWDPASPAYDPENPSSVDPVTEVSPPPSDRYLRGGRLTFHPNLFKHGLWTVEFDAGGYDQFDLQIKAVLDGRWTTVAVLEEPHFTFFVSGMDKSAGVRIVPYLNGARMDSEAFVIPPSDYDAGPAAVTPVSPPYILW